MDGYAGKKIFLRLHPVEIDACDEGHVALFGLPGNDPARYTQNQDLIDEVWAVDVDGLIVVLDATYSRLRRRTPSTRCEPSCSQPRSIDHQPHRADIGSRRTLAMNRNLASGLGAVAVVALLLIGCQSNGSASPSGEPLASAVPSTTEPSSSN